MQIQAYKSVKDVTNQFGIAQYYHTIQWAYRTPKGRFMTTRNISQMHRLVEWI
jgi:hypothetical protein